MSVEVGNALLQHPVSPLSSLHFDNVIKECCLKEIEIDMDNHNGSAWYFLIESLDLQAKFLAIFQLLSISSQSHWLGTGTGNSSVPELSTKLVRFSLQ